MLLWLFFVRIVNSLILVNLLTALKSLQTRVALPETKCLQHNLVSAKQALTRALTTFVNREAVKIPAKVETVMQYWFEDGELKPKNKAASTIAKLQRKTVKINRLRTAFLLCTI